VPESVLTVLKFCFLALVYLFLWRVVRVVWKELRAPAVVAADGAAATPARREPRSHGGPVRLRVLEPPTHRGEVVPLDTELTVGRGGGCGLVLADDQFVSTVHARVFRRGKDVYVEDLGSRNGTYVNGKKVATATRVRRGDHVQFGETVAELAR
jgi:hypothetical protein